VCSWSLQPEDSERLVDYLIQIGISQIQLALDPLCGEDVRWCGIEAQFEEAGITVVSGMFGTIGEDYTTLETIRCTGGVVPDEHWEDNWRNIQAVADIADNMELPCVTFHAGFLPHEENDPGFQKLFDRVLAIADLFNGRGIDLGFETGQETADTLRVFLEKLGRPGVGVNFDPANMILYDKGDPIEALRVLAPWLKQCHIKDATRARKPGTWGEEVPVGTGEVDWRTFFEVLNEVGFEGDCCIEREAGDQRVADIRAAYDFVTKL